MQQFSYVITDEIGIHARPAGMLVKVVKNFKSKITLNGKEKTADATKLMAVMSMGIKCGDTVEVSVEGEDETAAAAELETFFKENL